MKNTIQPEIRNIYRKPYRISSTSTRSVWYQPLKYIRKYSLILKHVLSIEFNYSPAYQNHINPYNKRSYNIISIIDTGYVHIWLVKTHLSIEVLKRQNRYISSKYTCVSDNKISNRISYNPVQRTDCKNCYLNTQNIKQEADKNYYKCVLSRNISIRYKISCNTALFQPVTVNNWRIR